MNVVNSLTLLTSYEYLLYLGTDGSLTNEDTEKRDRFCIWPALDDEIRGLMNRKGWGTEAERFVMVKEGRRG